MIKAIFFDWFGTLACFEPPREELYRRALGEFGIEVSPNRLTPGILAADEYFYEEHARSPVERREPQKQAEVQTRYLNIVLTGGGVKADQELLVKLMKRTQQLFRGLTFILFDDVLPVLKTLKGQRLILGLLTNASKSMISIYRKLGLEPYLDFVVTSDETGADKPEPAIFWAALEQAGVKTSEATHVGDQYKIDVVGARGVGIKPILIDRHNLYPQVNDCPRICNLTELAQYL